MQTTASNQLTNAAEAAIRACRIEPNPVAGSGEVAEVARLVLQLPEKLVREWRKHLASGEIDVIGVFSHKTPKTSWTDPLEDKKRRPELCDLLLIFDSEDSKSRTQRALLIQAKVAVPGTKAGQFSVSKNGEDVQRYLYAHLPEFALTGLKPKPHDFNVAPSPTGSCLGTRYACINVSSPAPNSGWWLESAQPQVQAKPSTVADYAGTYDAKVSLGQALHDMLVGTLGEVLATGGEWRRLVDHLQAVAGKRQKAGKRPPDVAAADGTVLPHMASAALFLANATQFFETRATSGYARNQIGAMAPPRNEVPVVTVDEKSPGFGIIYIRVISPEWLANSLA